jgi:hypothetical protein
MILKKCYCPEEPAVVMIFRISNISYELQAHQKLQTSTITPTFKNIFSKDSRNIPLTELDKTLKPVHWHILYCEWNASVKNSEIFYVQRGSEGKMFWEMLI